MITSNSRKKIKRFNQIGLHYNLVADSVYKIRASINDGFDSIYRDYIIAALVSFEMGRMMGPDAHSRYDKEAGGFATKLVQKLEKIKSLISHLSHTDLATFDISNEYQSITEAYIILAAGGKDGLNQRGGEFHVGATKILHFLYPEAFLIIDSNAARAFRFSHGIGFRKSTQPGYSAEKYISCMKLAQQDIITFGVDAFKALDKDTPIARIYDKLTFITGSDIP